MKRNGTPRHAANRGKAPSRAIDTKLAPGVSTHLARVMATVEAQTGHPPAVVVHSHAAVVDGAVTLCAMGAHFGTLGAAVQAITLDLFLGASGLAPKLALYAPALGLAVAVAERASIGMESIHVSAAENGDLKFTYASEGIDAVPFRIVTMAELLEKSVAHATPEGSETPVINPESWARVVEALAGDIRGAIQAPAGA